MDTTTSLTPPADPATLIRTLDADAIRRLLRALDADRRALLVLLRAALAARRGRSE